MTENRPADRRCGAVELAGYVRYAWSTPGNCAVEVAKSLPVSTALVMQAFRFFGRGLPDRECDSLQSHSSEFASGGSCHLV
jgi:hypothetical protein